MGALILHPLVPREDLEEARRALRLAHYTAMRDISEALTDGIEAAVWALAEVQAEDARTLRGRIFAVAARALEPDAAAELMTEIASEPDARALLLAVRRLAQGVA